MLSFGMDSSKFDEVKVCKISEKDKMYPTNILDLMKKRLANNKLDTLE